MSSGALRDVGETELLEEYTRHASAHGRATMAGDPKSANREYHALHSVFSELRRRGPGDIKKLSKLLKSDEASVRLWSAAHLLSLGDDLTQRQRWRPSLPKEGQSGFQQG